MSTFTPTRTILEPAQRPDNLSAAVVHSLSRPIFGRITWGPISSLILGGLTFGIFPLISWPKRFGRFVIAEQQQFWHLVEWLRIRTGDEEASRLTDSVNRTGAAPTLWLVPFICLIVLVVNFFPWFSAGFNWDHLVRWTYGSAPLPLDRLMSEHGFHFSSPSAHLFNVWTFCLSVAYISHWLHVRQHVSNVNQLLRRLNLIFARQNIPPVPLFEAGIGLRPLWMLAAFIGLCCGAVWAIPAALAGAVHQRYCRKTSTRIRAELAMRATTLLHQQRPAMNVPIPHGFRVVCRNPLCNKSLPGGSAFCSRCGTHIPTVDGVA